MSITVTLTTHSQEIAFIIVTHVAITLTLLAKCPATLSKHDTSVNHSTKRKPRAGTRSKK